MVTIEPSPIPEDAVATVAEVADALAPRRTEVSVSISDALATRIDELRGDPALRDLLGASVEGNVETILHVLRHDLDPRGVEPPAAAVAYAERLAQRGVPVNALIRAYRVGQAHLMEWAFAEAARRLGATAASQRIVLVVMDYVDHVTQHVVAAYEAERDRTRRSRHALRVARVRDVLAGRAPTGPDDRLAVESTLGYRFSAVHLGLVVWLEPEPPEGAFAAPRARRAGPRDRARGRGPPARGPVGRRQRAGLAAVPRRHRPVARGRRPHRRPARRRGARGVRVAHPRPRGLPHHPRPGPPGPRRRAAAGVRARRR